MERSESFLIIWTEEGKRMKPKNWILRENDDNAVAELCAAGIPDMAAKVLAARGIRTPEEAGAFLSVDTGLIGDPSIMADMGKGVERIKRALCNKEKIAVFGDYDVDGISSVCLMVSWLRSKGADCSYYIPERDEGYGINLNAIDTLKSRGVTLIITVDLGVTAANEVDYAAKQGIDIVITDHHECRSELPNAVAVINPYREDCPYYFKQMAGVGVAFCVALCTEGLDNYEKLLKMYSDLVALGTIADVMPLIGLNRAWVARGLEEMNKGYRIGLRTIIKESTPGEGFVNSGIIGFSVSPRINAAGRMGSAEDAVRLFLTEDHRQAQQLTQRLCELNRQRQRTENEIYEDAITIAEEYLHENGIKHPKVLVLSNSMWHQGVIGIVASRLSERYACPVFLICVENGVGKGSARSFFGTDIFEAMQKNSELFESWGGHKFAAGFTIKEENIEAFRQSINECSKDFGSAHVLADVEVKLEDITVSTLEGLEIMEPYGSKNEPPRFLIRDVRINNIVPMGWGRSARMEVEKDGYKCAAFFFGMDVRNLDICEGDRGDLLCRAEIDEHRNQKTVKLVLQDIRPGYDNVVVPYQREIELFRKLKNGEVLTKEQAEEIIPGKKEFIAVLRHIRRNCDKDRRLVSYIGSLCRRICREEHIPEGYAKLLVCIDVLAEKQRLSYYIDDHVIAITLKKDATVNLNDAQLMLRLKEYICRN